MKIETVTIYLDEDDLRDMLNMGKAGEAKDYWKLDDARQSDLDEYVVKIKWVREVVA